MIENPYKWNNASDQVVLRARRTIGDLLTGTKDVENLLYPICNMFAVDIINRRPDLASNSGALTLLANSIAYDIRELGVFPTPATKISSTIVNLVSINRMYMRGELAHEFGVVSQIPADTLGYIEKHKSKVIELVDAFKVLMRYGCSCKE